MTTTPEQLTPSTNWVMLRKCGPGQQQQDGTWKDGVLYLPDDYERYAWQNWLELVDVGPECKWFKREHCWHGRYPQRGGIVWVQDGAAQEHCIDRDTAECQYWMEREPHLQPWFVEHGRKTITILANFVLVETTWVTQQGGIELPDESQYYQKRGRVRACGPEVEAVLGEALPINTMVLFAKRVKVFMLGGVYLAVMPAGDIEAIVEGED
jgi:hypothetical protein